MTLPSPLRSLINTCTEIYLNDSLVVEGINPYDDECIHINCSVKELYALELVSTSNATFALNEEQVSQISTIAKHNESGYIYFVILKQHLFQRVLIFARDKHILEPIKNFLPSRFLRYDEMINVIYDLFLQNKYEEVNKIIERKTQILEDKRSYANLSHTFNAIVKEAVFGSIEETVVYQAHQYKHKRDDYLVNYDELLRGDYIGAIWFYINFSERSTKLLLNSTKKEAKWNNKGKLFEALERDYLDGKVDLCIINSVIVLQKDKSNEMTRQKLQNLLKVDYTEKHLHKLKLLKKTPLLFTDRYYDYLVESKFLSGLIGSNIKSSLESGDSVDVRGQSITGNYYPFSFSKIDNEVSTTNKHSVIVGISGSGKTTSTNKITAELIDLEVESGNANFDKHLIRYFDIKKSGESVLKALERGNQKDNVTRITTDLNRFRFNPINIAMVGNVVDQNELNLSIYILNTIIETKDKHNVLTSDEQMIIKKHIEELYNDGNYNIDKITTLNNSSTKAIYEELMGLGYQDVDLITAIKEVKYSHLKKPRLKDLLNLIEIKAKQINSHIEQKNYEKTIAKVKSIVDMPIFSNYETVFNKADIRSFINIDFDHIKDDDTNYIAIFLALFLNIYKSDKERQEEAKKSKLQRKTIHYIFEEAYNVLSKGSFIDLIKKVMNEARSYNIRICFVTQLIEHIPQDIFKQVEHKFILLPKNINRIPIIDELRDIIKLNKQTEYKIMNAPDYTILLINSGGISLFKLDMSKEEVDVFGQSSD